MVYLTSFPNVTFKVEAKSTILEPPAFLQASFSFLSNWNEIATASFAAKGNNVLYLRDIQRTTFGRRFYPNEHLGTELFIASLREMISAWGISPKRIDGVLSSADAQNHNWDVSIPFYFHLPIYMRKHLQTNFSFHIYYDKERTQELRWENYGCDIKTAAKAIRQEFEKSSKDLYFSFLLL